MSLVRKSGQAEDRTKAGIPGMFRAMIERK